MFSINLPISVYVLRIVDYLHSTMFSINPRDAWILAFQRHNLHSTMFSINQGSGYWGAGACRIYIPLCFLLIQAFQTFVQ